MSNKDLTDQIKAKDKWINQLLDENAEMQEGITNVIEYWIEGAYTELTWDEQLASLEVIMTKLTKRGLNHNYPEEFIALTQ